MRVTPNPLDCIESAIVELGYPKATWFRGHTAEHSLRPTLFRFPGCAEMEHRIIQNYREQLGRTKPILADCLNTLLVMHDKYLPTRLIAWTDSMSVALFCALVRESEQAAVFVLDPVTLNRNSGIADIIALDSGIPSALVPFSERPLAEALPMHPVALRHKQEGREASSVYALFTLHGQINKSLEEQCPTCVRKVVLTAEHRKQAKEFLLSAWKL